MDWISLLELNANANKCISNAQTTHLKDILTSVYRHLCRSSSIQVAFNPDFISIFQFFPKVPVGKHVFLKVKAFFRDEK